MNKNDIDNILALTKQAMQNNPQWRKGQALWNSAESYIYENGTADQINNFEDMREKYMDCFKEDDLYESFIEALRSI